MIGWCVSTNTHSIFSSFQVNMHLTLIIDGREEPFGIDVDPSITLEDLSGLVEIELRIPSAQQHFFLRGTRLQRPPQTTLAECGITTDEIMELKQVRPSSSPLNPRAPPIAGGNIANDIDRMRLQILGDPALMSQLRASNPELANAAEQSPERFAELMRTFQQQQQSSARQRRQDEELLHSDPFDIEAQRRIEEHIRQERVWENMQHAIEFSPESFGRVTMLYVDVEVNGHPVKAFVDSGAQMTIMSPNCAQTTGIMRLIDERFSGIARGVGTAKILGRVHSAQMKISDLHLPCSFTIMEGKGVELLFGLDMLKRHQAVIDLSKNALIIQGKEVRFLSEHELPASAKEGDHEAEDESSEIERAKNQSLLEDNSQKVIADTANRSATQPPANGLTPPSPSMGRLGSARGLSPDHKAKVETLVGFGADPIQAEALLRSTDWNVDLAASLLFSQ
ncbi:DNA damage-inducible protein 1 [Puccinia graminis f. sp. tritici]|uniref:DNA damage-inducible protein 1 n=1 Tax=Puccinia graminis f. sp. tritici TaxID=56615 RepID=A0A5B0RHT0_PUCGR|nr:DNA damage-inducible protein 1 [Puccinia graminis f. sp. tritici]